MTRLALAAAVVVALALAGCQPGGFKRADVSGRQVKVVTTANFITDLVEQVGGDRVEVTGLMGPGVDPHLYKASARDVETLREADMAIYGGLNLEGRMGDLFYELGRRRPVLAVTDGVPRRKLRRLTAEEVDPHVWFDLDIWQDATRTVARGLGDLDPAHRDEYARNAAAYVTRLRALDAEIKRKIATIPPRQRLLITSHDAFFYFGARYGVQVEAIQGTSTQTEATTRDIERIAELIAERDLPAVFVESSVPRQTIDAVLASAARRGQRARVGGELFSDAAGQPGTSEGTYLGMVRHNVDLITKGLRG